MDSHEARRIVADIVLADVASDRSDTDDQREIGDRLHDATLDNRAAEDYRALLWRLWTSPPTSVCGRETSARA